MSLPPAHTIDPVPGHPDWQLLRLLLDLVETGRACAITELASRSTSSYAAVDGLGRLKENGLIIDIKGYVLPTIAAISYHQLERLIRNPRQLRLPL
jgi:hypothetical protein